MTGVVAAEIVAVLRSCTFGAHYLEAYENEELFWDTIAESGPPERAYRLSGDMLVEWDFAPGLSEMRDDETIDRWHRNGQRIA